MIKEFQGKYRWLSNFWPVDIEYKGRVFKTVEHAYMSEKNDADIWKDFCAHETDPKIVNKMSRIILLRSDWDIARVEIMRELSLIKYQNPELREKLLSTADEYLQEGNTWGDVFWGIDIATGKGENNFGKILMDIRTELTKELHE